jgi:hypothetical protein
MMKPNAMFSGTGARKPESEPNLNPVSAGTNVRPHRVEFKFNERSLESLKRLQIECDEIKLKDGLTIFLPRNERPNAALSGAADETTRSTTTHNPRPLE